MGKIKNKLYDWKDRLRKGKMFTLVVSLVSIIITLTVFSLSLFRKYRELSENSNNQAFYELIEYVNNTEKLLAKATISNDSRHGAMVLTSTWKMASLAQSYLSRIPIDVQNLENVNKFLNQVGDYCYVLSKKNINGENLSQEDLDNLTSLHLYSIQLESTLNQLQEDLYSQNIKWGRIAK
ncbi:MAG: germination protein YpeB [Clostridia bacterium]|nr:germination protein YpeB [Clostridia bacterium]